MVIKTALPYGVSAVFVSACERQAPTLNFYLCAAMSNPQNIHPIYDRMLGRSDKEQLLGQRGLAVWMTGLSGSGKSTIGLLLERILHDQGILTRLLDGDNVRDGINKNLGFSEEDRTENIRRIAEVNKLFVDCGVVTINCFVSPTQAIRRQAREIIGDRNFVEVFVNTSLEVCEERDVKGLYAKARSGEIKNFTGIDAPFEAPTSPEVTLLTRSRSPEESAQELFAAIEKRIKPDLHA